MNRLQLQKMLLCFQILKAHGPQHLTEGICHNVDTVMMDMGCTLKDGDGNPYKVMEFYRHQLKIVKQWPEYSGTASYPINTYNLDGYNEHQQYARALACGGQWSQTEYGNARRRLLDFIIGTLQEQLK